MSHITKCNHTNNLFDRDHEFNMVIYEHVQDINFLGSIYPTHFAIPHLMRTGGKIVVNASSAGVMHPPKGGFYNVTNHFQ